MRFWLCCSYRAFLQVRAEEEGLLVLLIGSFLQARMRRGLSVYLLCWPSVAYVGLRTGTIHMRCFKYDCILIHCAAHVIHSFLHGPVADYFCALHHIELQPPLSYSARERVCIFVLLVLITLNIEY